MPSRAWARGSSVLLARWVCGTPQVPSSERSQVGSSQQAQAKQTFPEKNQIVIVAAPLASLGGRKVLA